MPFSVPDSFSFGFLALGILNPASVLSQLPPSVERLSAKQICKTGGGGGGEKKDREAGKEYGGKRMYVYECVCVCVWGGGQSNYKFN